MTTRLLITLLLVLQSFDLFALGLGDIRVDSHLNQPLRAQIDLISADTLDIGDIKPRLASQQAHDKAGVARAFVLSRLRFKVQSLGDGRRQVVITSHDAIREPFLNFLVELSWPTGSMVREYTLLLDPPAYRPVLPVSSGQSGAVATTAQQPGLVDRYGPVAGSETLWEIAERVRPDSSLTIPQVMMGLQRANPAAFQDGNINILRRGVMLEVPSAREMASLSAADALSGFRQQTRQWRGQASAPATPDTFVDGLILDSGVVAPEADQPAAQETAAELATAPVGMRLRVVEADRQWQLSDTSHIVYPLEDADKLKEAIADSQQDLAAVQEINQDIEGLRHALEAKVEALRLALEEKDEAIEDLRMRLEVASMGAVDEASTGSTPQSASGGQATGQGVPPAPAEPADDRADYWAVVTSVAIVLGVAGVLLLLRLRRREKTYEQMSEYDPFDARAEAPAPPADFEQTISKTMEFPREEHIDESNFTVDEETFTGSHTDTASILTEADIYLAYRRYSQAEELVIEALEHNPKHAELEAKLLEIYAFKKDQDAFVGYLEKVAGPIRKHHPDIWLRIVDMGQDLGLTHRLLDVAAPGVTSAAPEAAEPLPEAHQQNDQSEEIDQLADELLAAQFETSDYQQINNDVDTLAQALSEIDGAPAKGHSEEPLAVHEDEDDFMPDLDQPEEMSIPAVDLRLPEDDEEDIPTIDIDLDEFEESKKTDK